MAAPPPAISQPVPNDQFKRTVYKLKFGQSGTSSLWKARYPDYEIRFTDFAYKHPHPYLAFERAAANDRLYELARMEHPGWHWLDVGGSAARNRHRPDVWNCKPLIEPEDFIYENTHINVCKHRLQECNHCVGPRMGLLLIHSLYYISPVDLAAGMKIRGGIAYAAVHQFDHPYGRIAVDAHYEAVDAHNIIMRVDGGRVYGPHSALRWLTPSGACPTPHGSLVWTYRNRIGDTHMYTFRLVAQQVPVNPPSRVAFWTDEYALDSSYEGQLRISGRDGLMLRTSEGHFITVRDVWAFRGFHYYTTTEDKLFVVPTDLLARCELSISGQPRTPATLRALYAFAKRTMEDIPMTNRHRAAVLPFVVALAMTRGVENEIAAASHLSIMDARLTRLNALQNDWRDLTPPFKKYAIPLLFGVSMAAYFGYCAYKRRRPIALSASSSELLETTIISPIVEETIKSLLGYVVRIPSTIFGCFEFAVRWCRRQQQPGPVVPPERSSYPPLVFHALIEPLPWTQRTILHMGYNATIATCRIRSGLQPASLGGWSLIAAIGLVGAAYCYYRYRRFKKMNAVCLPDLEKLPEADYINHPQSFIPGACTIKSKISAKKIAATTAIIRTAAAVGEKAYGRSGVITHVLVGLGLLKAPAIMASTRENEYIAIANRMFPVGLPQPNPGFLRCFLTFVRKNFTMLLGPRKKVKPLSYQAWNCRYDATVRANHDFALHRLKHHYPTEYEQTKTKMFVKMELLCGKVQVVDPEGDLDATPRGIQAAEDEYNVQVGPWIAALQAHFRTQMTGASIAYMTCSTTQEDMGRWFTKWYDQNAQFIENDYSTYDATQHEAIRELAIWLYEQYGLPAPIARLMRAKIKKHGCSAHGVHFVGNATMASGDPDTFLSNSIINALVCWFLIKCADRTILADNFPPPDNECHICREPVHNDDRQRCNNPACTFIMHRACYERCQRRDCPQCRASVDVALRIEPVEAKIEAVEYKYQDDFRVVEDMVGPIIGGCEDDPDILRESLVAVAAQAERVYISNLALSRTSLDLYHEGNTRMTASMLVAGDDNLLAIIRPHPALTRILDAGCQMLGLKGNAVFRGRDVHKIEYCSGLFWPVNELQPPDAQQYRYVFGPKPGRVLCKLPYVKVNSGRSDQNRGQLAQFRGNLLGLVDTTYRIPVLREYISAMLSLTNKVEATPTISPYSVRAEISKQTNDAGLKAARLAFAHDPVTLTFMRDRYGWTPQDLRDFVTHLRSIKRLPARDHFFRVHELYDADVADVDEGDSTLAL